jgi:hypothetical protein
VLTAEGIVLPAPERREPRPARPWPDWAELVPGVIWFYDFAHFRASRIPGHGVDQHPQRRLIRPHHPTLAHDRRPCQPVAGSDHTTTTRSRTARVNNLINLSYVALGPIR